MYGIKRETEEVLCRGCLSTDRKLSPLTNYDLYCTLLGIKQSSEEYKYVSILLCWECLALLRRTEAFRHRLQSAQHTLSLAYRELSTNTLSNLKFTRKENYDYIIEDRPQNIPPNSNIDIKEELELELDSFTDNCNENIDEITIEKKEECSQKRKYKKQKEGKRAQRVETIIDMNDVDKYFTNMCLSERVVDEMLERERGGDTELRRHQCGTCRLRFLSKTELNNHRKNYHTRRSTTGKCPHCTFTYKTQWDLQLHWWRSHPVNRCSLCDQVILRDKDKRQHLERHRFRYRCTKCGMEFDNSQLYNYHDKQLHSKYVCDHCGRNNATKTSLLKHILRQHLPNPCPSCPCVFPSYQRLTRHLRAAHPSGERAYCVECDMTFPNASKYRRHLATARRHRPAPRLSIPCPECGKIFSRKTYMNNHMKLFHSNESRHHCQLCNKYFVTGFSLRCHNKYVHEKIPMPKNKFCNVCGRGFATNRVLENHMRTHTGERPFACAHCSAAFAQRVALKAHLGAVHKEKIDGAGTGVS